MGTGWQSADPPTVRPSPKARGAKGGRADPSVAVETEGPRGPSTRNLSSMISKGFQESL